MNPNKPARILLIKDGGQYWIHGLENPQPEVHVALMDVTGKTLEEAYPIDILIAGGSEEEHKSLQKLAVDYANNYRANGHLNKDLEIARLRAQLDSKQALND